MSSIILAIDGEEFTASVDGVTGRGPRIQDAIGALLDAIMPEDLLWLRIKPLPSEDRTLYRVEGPSDAGFGQDKTVASAIAVYFLLCGNSEDEMFEQFEAVVFPDGKHYDGGSSIGQDYKWLLDLLNEQNQIAEFEGKPDRTYLVDIPDIERTFLLIRPDDETEELGD